MPSKFKLSDFLYIDASAISLLLANLATIAIALWQNWSAGEVIVIYFIQSLAIGFFQFFKLLDLENFSTEGVQINGAYVGPSKNVKYFFTGFFVMHFGIFHLVYLVFLIVYLSIGYVSLAITPLFLLSILLVVSNHAISYALNRENDKKRNINISKLFFIPYGRILPMHIIIILMGLFASTGGGNNLVLLIFMGLKTIADLITHNAEHKLYLDIKK